MKKKVKNKILGIIHIGSRTVRFIIGQTSKTGKIEFLEKLWAPLGIGREIFSGGMISNETISELIKIIQNYQQVAETYSVEQIRAVATSVLREAVNSDMLVSRIETMTGIKIKNAEPAEEAYVVYNALKKDIPKILDIKDKNIFIIIAGSGSTQMIFQKSGRIIYFETFQVGALRIQKNPNINLDSYKIIIDGLGGNLYRSFGSTYGKERIDKLIIINEDSLNIIKENKVERIKKRESLIYKITKNEFSNITQNVLKMSAQKLQNKYKLSETSIQNSIVTMLYLNRMIELIKPQKIVFPEIGFSAAVLMQTSVNKEKKLIARNLETRHNIVSQAFSIAQKYNADIEHCKRARKIALMLFSHLKELFNFTENELLYLDIASILHNIGKFINHKSHHKHSATLISSSEILGLKKKDIQIIAQIARYHRHALPKETHNSYMNLSESDRLTVSRMASILRIADALTKTNALLVDNLKITVSKSICEIAVKMKNNDYSHFELIKSDALEKSDLLSKVFGLKLIIEKSYETY